MTPDSTALTLIVLSVATFILFFHRAFGGLFRLLLRTGGSVAFLSVLAQVPALSSVALGVNPFNALVLGVLGVPGFGLLLMLRWMLR